MTKISSAADRQFNDNQILVRVPAHAIKGPDDFVKVAKAAFARGGCPTCFSGLDIRFAQVRDYVVDPQTLDVHEASVER